MDYRVSNYQPRPRGTLYLPTHHDAAVKPKLPHVPLHAGRCVNGYIFRNADMKLWVHCNEVWVQYLAAAVKALKRTNKLQASSHLLPYRHDRPPHGPGSRLSRTARRHGARWNPMRFLFVFPSVKTPRKDDENNSPKTRLKKEENKVFGYKSPTSTSCEVLFPFSHSKPVYSSL